MKNSVQFIITLLAIALTVHNGSLFSQSSSNNNTPAIGKFLGYNAGGIDLDFKTNNINRMRLMETSTSIVDGYSINNSGFLGMSIEPIFFTQKEPYSLLHLNGFNSPAPQELGYRSWMRPGITFTHNGDLMYIGPKANAQDVTDAVISWSDNAATSSIGPDVLRFLFTGGGGGATNISSNPLNGSDFDGIEVARMTGTGKTGLGSYWTNQYLPQRTLDVILQQDVPQFRITRTRSTNINSGINADFQVSTHGNLHILPRRSGAQRAVAIGFLDDPADLTDPFHSPTASTRLDVNGLTRIRSLSDETPASLIMGYRIPGANNDIDDQFLGRIDFPAEEPECHVLNGEGEWLDICDLGGGGQDCRWEDINSISIPGQIDMFTGVDGQDPCYRSRVGIGISNLEKAKLNVENVVDRDESFIGIYGNSVGFIGNLPIRTLVGIVGAAEADGFPQSLALNIGVRGEGRESLWAIGVDGAGLGFPIGAASTVTAMGVRGIASGAQTNYSVYGELLTGQPGFAGYFAGPLVFSQPPIGVSDESVKSEVEDLTDATSILTSLQPKTYYYQSPENRPINFDLEMQYGFIAQEVQEIIPTIVKMTHTPELTDSLGIIEGTSVDLLGIQYQSIIPILVAGFKEQNTTISTQATLIAAQNEIIAALEDQLYTQAEQLEEMQNNMQSVLDAVQQMQQKTNNCCTQKAESGNTGAVINKDFKQLKLEQNVPNPFDDQTRIAFNLPNEAQVILEITDAAGRPLERLIDGQLSNGEHTTLWDGSNVASGIYFYTLYADGELITKKMIKK